MILVHQREVLESRWSWRWRAYPCCNRSHFFFITAEDCECNTNKYILIYHNTVLTLLDEYNELRIVAGLLFSHEYIQMLPGGKIKNLLQTIWYLWFKVTLTFWGNPWTGRKTSASSLPNMPSKPVTYTSAYGFSSRVGCKSPPFGINHKSSCRLLKWPLVC